MTEEENRQRLRAEYELHCRTFATLDGAASLIQLYGEVPHFHDAEICELKLLAKGVSSLRISTPFPNVFGPGRVMITLHVEELADIQLTGFSPQNVLYSLDIHPAQANPDREPYCSRRLAPGDLDVKLATSYGIEGTMRCGRVAVTWSMERRDDE